MKKTTILLSSFLFAACSAVSTPKEIAGNGIEFGPATTAARADVATSVTPMAGATQTAPTFGTAAYTARIFGSSSPTDAASYEYSAPLRREDAAKTEEGDDYIKLKLGAFKPSGDLSGFSTGFAGDVVFGHQVTPNVAVEGTIGYFDTNGTTKNGGKSLSLWAIPVFFDLKLSLPVSIFELYAGAGLGGLYTDWSGPIFGGGADWLWAWDAFLGAEAELGEIALGLEYRYLASEESYDGFAVEGSSAFAFLKLPF